MQPPSAAALSLLGARAVRERAHRLLELGLEGKLGHFRIDLAKLPDAAALTIETTRAAYPTLDTQQRIGGIHLEMPAERLGGHGL